MGWGVEGTGSYDWPADLLRTSHSKGNKKEEIEEILDGLDTAKRLQEAISNFPFPKAKASRNTAVTWANDAQDFFDGAAFKKLMGSLKVLAKRVTEALKVKTLSSDAKKSLKDIQKSLDEIIESVAPNVIGPQIARMVSVLMAADKEFTLKNLKTMFTSYKACAGRKHPGITKAAQELKNWSDDPLVQQTTRNVVHGQIYNDCRDMTQNLQNLVKAQEYGGDLSGLEDRDVATIPKIAKVLIPFANAKTSFTDGMDLPALVKLVRTIKVHADLYDDIAKRVP